MRDIKVYFAGEHEPTVNAAHQARWRRMAAEKTQGFAEAVKINGRPWDVTTGNFASYIVCQRLDASGFEEGRDYDLRYVELPPEDACYLTDLLTELRRIGGPLAGRATRRSVRRFLIGGPLYKFDLVLKTDDPLTAQRAVEDLLARLDGNYERAVRNRFSVSVEVVQNYRSPGELRVLKGAS